MVITPRIDPTAGVACDARKIKQRPMGITPRIDPTPPRAMGTTGRIDPAENVDGDHLTD